MSKPRSKQTLRILVNTKDTDTMMIADVIRKYFPSETWEVVAEAKLSPNWIGDALIVIASPGLGDKYEEQVSALLVKPKNHIAWIGHYPNRYATKALIMQFNNKHFDPVAIFKTATKPLKKRKPSVLIVARQDPNREEVPYMDAVIEAFKKAGWVIKRRVEEIPNRVTTDCMVVIAFKTPHHHEQQFLRMITVPPYTIWWGPVPKEKKVQNLVDTLTEMTLIDWNKQVAKLSV